MTYVELTGSGWRPEVVSAAAFVSTGARQPESGLCQHPSSHPGSQAARQPGRPLSAAVDSERVYQYARRTPCMNVCFLVALGGMGRVAVCVGGVSGCLLDQGSLDV